MIAPETLTGGFADPVFEAQAVFRKVLDAVARPGTIVPIPEVVRGPAPLHPPAAAFLAALADEGTPVHFAGEDSRAAAAWVSFHTGAPSAPSPETAAFAIVTEHGALPPFEAYALGSQEYPDRSTTILLQLEEFLGGAPLRLEGPGIEGAADIHPRPLPKDFVLRMRRNRSLFPRGVDLLFVSPAAILALPRSVRVTSPGEG